jgi:hypothetical protein
MMNDERKSGQSSVVSCQLLALTRLSHYGGGVKLMKLEQLTTDN